MRPAALLAVVGLACGAGECAGHAEAGDALGCAHTCARLGRAVAGTGPECLCSPAAAAARLRFNQEGEDMLVYWKAGAARADGRGAAVVVRAEDAEGGVREEGEVYVTGRGRLVQSLVGEGAPRLPDSLRRVVGFGLGGLSGLERTAAEAAREAGLIPIADPQRDIGPAPRILTVAQDDGPGEGCVVVLDNPRAIAASPAKYRGPPGPPNLDFVSDPAGLPGRRYLSVADSQSRPLPPPRSLDGHFAVFDADGVTLVQTDAWATIYRTWDDAEAAISRARELGILP